MRLVCAHFRDVTFDSTYHLWMDGEEEETSIDTNDGRADFMSARRMRLFLENFPNLRSLRVIGLRLVYQSLVRGRNGAAASPRYICSLLQEAECARNLECLEILDVSESQTENGEWGAASPPSYSLHTDIQLEQLRKLTITMGNTTNRENPLVHSLLRSSHQLTHLNLSGCSCFSDYHVEEAIVKPLVNTLTHLNLSGSAIQHPSIRSTILKTLILQRCINLSALNPDSSCPSLKVLDLSSCPAFNGEGLLDVESGLNDFCPRLSTLNLRNCTALRYLKIKLPLLTIARCSAGDESVGLSNPAVSETLENIDLSMCVHLASVNIACPLKMINLGQCMHLKVLSISSPVLEMIDLSRLPLMLISIYCPSLVHLNLAWCGDLDSKRSIINCKALESVDIRGAVYMTPEFFNDAKRKSSLSICK